MSSGLSVRARTLALCAVLCLQLLACGGGGGSGTISGSTTTTTTGTTAAANVLALTVDGGPSSLSSPDVNTLFTTVTICVPGTSTCQSIDHIEIDTGSFGLRILSSALTLTLPAQMATNGDALVECTKFVDGHSWGPIGLADVKLSGEIAGSVPVQVIGDSNYTTVPADCASVGPEEDTVDDFRANGVLGVGVFGQDCGSGCAATVDNNIYYACSSASQCASIAAPLTMQVTNPVIKFDADNNGVIITMASVPIGGAATVEGTMTFGIDTQTNNASGGQSVIDVDPSTGQFSTVFNGHSYDASFLDTGSNGFFFVDSSIEACQESGLTDFYCPASALALSATLSGQNSMSASVDFTIADASTLSGSITAAPNLGGPYPASAMTDSFDWGLPFYFGRTVYTAFENVTTMAGAGPYVAF
jgi:hypothetical protein